MSTTATALRSRVGRILDPAYTSVQLTTGSTTTLQRADWPLLDPAASAQRFAGGVWVRPSAAVVTDFYRRASAYVPTTGVVTIYAAQPYTNAPAGGEVVEYWGAFDPSQVLDYANRAAETMNVLEEVDLAGVSGQRQYGLSAYTWLTRPDQLVAVLQRYGSTAGAYLYDALPGAYVSRDESALTLNLTDWLVGPSDTVRLLGVRDYAGTATLADGSAVATDAPLAWLAYETALLMLREPAGGRYAPDMDPAQQRQEVEIERKCVYWRSLHAPAAPRRLFAVAPYFGPR